MISEPGGPAAATPPRVLVVEDNDDMCTLIEMAAEREGVRCEVAATAESALQMLARSRYDLLLVDYMLPGRNGAWLLRQAHDRGLLTDTDALIVTAHPDAPELEGRRDVVPKPVNFADFAPQIRRIAEGRARRANGDDGGGAAPKPPIVELVLYVTPDSLACQRALRVLRDILEQYEAAQIDFTVRNLADDPTAAERDKVVFTPTLVKRSPLPHVWILGDLSRREVVTDLLDLCGLSPTSR